MFRLIFMDPHQALAVSPADPTTVPPSSVTYLRMHGEGGFRQIPQGIAKAIHALGTDEPLRLPEHGSFSCPHKMQEFVQGRQTWVRPCKAIA